VLYQYQGTVNALGTWLWGESSGPAYMVGQAAEVGFSTSGRLSSLLTIIEKPDPTPIVKITCDHNPGYLRACAFEGYTQAQWYDRSPHEALRPTPGLSLQAGRRRFMLSNADVSNSLSMTIQHKTDLADTVFTRLGTTAIDLSVGALLRGDDGILRVRNAREDLTYKIFFGTGPERTPPDPAQRRRMQSPPQNLDPRIADLAAQVFAGCQSTADKIEAVIRHFQTHYSYALGLDVPQDRDPLTYFLLEANSGYCEYFASGAAILLRVANVPTRYVTGLLVTEKDPLENVWVARNSNAHAWVEAWDDDRGCWTLVEATVSQDANEGQGLGSGNSGDRSGWLAYQEFLRATYAYGLLGPVAWAVQYHPIGAAVAAILATLGLAALWAHLRRTGSSGGRGPSIRPDPVIQAMSRLLARMDRRLRRWGLVRDPAETLVAFAVRVEQHTPPDPRRLGAAQWYRQYSDLRYRPAVSVEDVQGLRQAARKGCGL